MEDYGSDTDTYVPVDDTSTSFDSYNPFYGVSGGADIYTPDTTTAYGSDGTYSQAGDSQYASEVLGITPEEMAQLTSQYPDTSTTGGTTSASLTSALSGLPKTIFDALKSRYTNAAGDVNWANLAKDALVAGSAYKAFTQASAGVPKTGYQGGIPQLTAVRQQLAPMATSRPGAGGQRYFSDTSYSTAAGLPAAQAAIAAQAADLETKNAARAQQINAAAPAAPTAEERQAAADRFFGRVAPPPAPAPVPAPAATPTPPQPMAHGGIAGLKHGTYLQGSTDGMADKLDTTIDDTQPAKLSHGEFVIPADVVSHLGNGNSDAGAKRLYDMMDKIRHARTGTKEQGKKINPDKFMPGGLAHAYAAGGEVRHFATGDAVGAASGVTGTESNLSNWAGPYVTNMLAKGEALSTQPYAAYQGPLTAGASELQQQGFGNAANLAVPTSIGTAAQTAGTIAGTPQTTSFTAPGTAAAYMSPYQQNVVDIQQREAQRTADIASTQRGANAAQAGAFGGSRQAIMDAEAARNLAIQKGDIQATGLQSAFKSAQDQFNAEQNAALAGKTLNLNAAQTQGTLGAAQNAAGLANLQAQLTAGGQQRDITSQGVAAEKAAFEEERANPYKMVQYQQSLLQGLPLAAQSYSITNNPYTAAAGAASTINTLLNPTTTNVP